MQKIKKFTLTSAMFSCSLQMNKKKLLEEI